MPDQLVTALANLGTLGPIIALMAWYIIRRDSRNDQVLDRLKETQDKRVEDVKGLAEKALAITDRQHETNAELAAAIRDQRPLLERLVEMIDRLPRRGA